MKIRIGIEKFNFFLIHLVRSVVECSRWDQSKQTQHSETKIVEDKSNLLQKLRKSKTKKVKSILYTIYMNNNSKAKDQVGN